MREAGANQVTMARVIANLAGRWGHVPAYAPLPTLERARARRAFHKRARSNYPLPLLYEAVP